MIEQLMKEKSTAFYDNPQGAFQTPQNTNEQVVATLMKANNGEWILKEYPDYAIEIAVSCIVEPMIDDRVVAFLDQDVFYILHILSRKQLSKLNCTFSGELEIKAQNIKLIGDKQVNISTENLALISSHSKWVSDITEQSVNNYVLKADNVFRQINVDETFANFIKQEAKSSFMLTSDLAFIKSTAVLKIDGAQVHMG